MSSDEKVKVRDYSHMSNRLLNRMIRKREQQLKNAIAEAPTSDKSVGQLKYELDMMTTALMERAMTKISEPRTQREEES